MQPRGQQKMDQTRASLPLTREALVQFQAPGLGLAWMWLLQPRGGWADVER